MASEDPAGQRHAHCEVCGTRTAVRPFYDSLVRCVTCDFVFCEGVNSLTLRGYYDQAYFSGNEYDDYVGDARIHRLNARRKMRVLERCVRNAGDLVEVGSAYGFFLDEARQKWQCRGFEICAAACDYACRELKLNVCYADILEHGMTGERYDIAVMWDTIEHVARPSRYVELLCESLRPGGHLAVTTGDISSPLARRRGSRWRQIHPPTHVSYFSVETMEKLLQRFGMHVVRVSHPGLYRSLAQVVFSVAVLGRVSRLGAAIHRALRRSPVGRLPVYTNFGDLMFVLARKETIGQQSE